VRRVAVSLAVLVGLAAVVLLVAGIGVWREHRNAPTQAPGHTAEYRPGQIDRAKARCVNAGETESFCDCAMDELARRFSPREFEQISSVAHFEDLPGTLARRAERTVDAVSRDCLRG